MTTYYVSSEIGDDNNAGTSGTAPLASLQVAANLVRPGDKVEVMNGTYYAPSYGDAVDITTSGTASAPITFEAAPGATPVIDSSGGWSGIKIEASYIAVKGFTIVGDAARYDLTSALAGYSAGNADLDGNGIRIVGSGAAIPNHITISNNTIYNEPGGGIAADGADYLTITNNVVHDNAHWSAYGCSGITINTSKNVDNNAGPHMVVSGNTAYNNAQLVGAESTGGAILDGEGIILDTNPGYTGGFLIQNNTAYGNGSAGIESFLSDNAVITGNTVYGNNTQHVQPTASTAQIFINQSSNNVVSNNSFTSSGGTTTGGGTTAGSGGTSTGGGTNASLANGNFATGDLTGWTLGGNFAQPNLPEIYVTRNGQGGSAYAAGMGSMGSDGTLSQTVATTAGQTYTLSFWLQNEGSTDNDFKATWNGQTLLSLSDATQSGYKQYTYSVTAAGPSSTLAFSAMNTPSQWDLDNVSLTASGPSLANGNFATGDLTGWTLGGNFAQPNLPEIYVTRNGQGGSAYAAGMGSMGSDGTLSQTVATTAGQTYTLSFWLQNEGSTDNDFKATWNGQTLLSLSDATQSGYKQYTYSVTAAGPSSTLAFSAMNTPSQWDLDNVSLTASGPSLATATAASLADVISSVGSSSGTALVRSTSTSTVPTLLSASSLPQAG